MSIPFRHTLRNTQCLMDWLNSSGYIFKHPANDAPVSGFCAIEKLPLELICFITAHISFKDKVHLSRVDKFFRNAVFSQVFASIQHREGRSNPNFASVCKSLTFRCTNQDKVFLAKVMSEYLKKWKQLKHVVFDGRNGFKSLFLPHNQLFPDIESVSFISEAPTDGTVGNVAYNALQSFPGITGLGVAIVADPQIDPCLRDAAVQLQLKTLHVKKAILSSSEIRELAQMFPTLTTLILEGAIFNNIFGDLLLSVQAMRQLEVLVFPKGSIRHPSGIIYNLFRHSTLRRIVAVEEPEHYTKVAELHQTAGEGSWTYKQKSFSTYAFWMRNYARTENIYSREFKWAVGAWPEGAPSPLDVL